MFRKILDGLKEALLVALVLTGVVAFVMVATYYKGITPGCEEEKVSAMWLGGMM